MVWWSGGVVRGVVGVLGVGDCGEELTWSDGGRVRG
jgi:hypothetical protein